MKKLPPFPYREDGQTTSLFHCMNTCSYMSSMLLPVHETQVLVFLFYSGPPDDRRYHQLANVCCWQCTSCNTWLQLLICFCCTESMKTNGVCRHEHLLVYTCSDPSFYTPHSAHTPISFRSAYKTPVLILLSALVHNGTSSDHMVHSCVTRIIWCTGQPQLWAALLKKKGALTA